MVPFKGEKCFAPSHSSMYPHSTGVGLLRKEGGLCEHHTHIFILMRMDQFHKSLDDLLLIKPLKREKISPVQYLLISN